MVIEWDFCYTASVRRGFVVELFEKHGIFQEFKTKHWPVGNTPAGETKRRRYLRIKTQYDDFLAGHSPEPAAEDASEESSEASQTVEFALEAHLRDFLARNLDTIETGLRLYESDGRKGIEFPIDGGRIDLLAVDAKGKYVVIELKLSQGRNKTLGQLLYYMAWVDQHMAQEQPCRGLIVASEITEELSLAVSRAPDVSLARYRMSFAIDSVVSA